MYFAGAKQLDKILHSVMMIRSIVSEKEAGKRRHAVGFGDNNDCLQLKSISLNRKKRKEKRNKRTEKKEIKERKKESIG